MTNPSPLTVAAIDLGSNSFRLLIGRIRGATISKRLYSRLATVGLGRGVARGKQLNQAALDRAWKILARFRAAIDRFPVNVIRACGTQALRLATNRDVFISRAEQILGTPVTVISGTQEATLTWAGITSTASMRLPAMAIDVGGCSTELIVQYRPDSIPQSYSLPTGALQLTEYGAGKASNPETQLRHMAQEARRQLQAGLSELLQVPEPPVEVWAAGGTATAVAMLDQKLVRYQRQKIQGHLLPVQRLATICNHLVAIPAEERDQLPGLQNGRGAIIAGGLTIYRQLAALLGLQHLTVTDAGLLEGILLNGAEPGKSAALGTGKGPQPKADT